MKHQILNALKPYLLLSFLCLVLYVPGIASIPITDRDEPHFAQTSRQLLETGDYLQLKFQNEARHLKPPGIYWLQALSARIFTEVDNPAIWAYRLPSLLGALLAVLFSYGFARNFLGERSAFWGAALLASSLLLTAEAHLSLSDAVLLFSIVLMQGALWKIYVSARQEKRLHPAWVILFWVAMAFGVLIKGLNPIFALLTIFGLCLADRQWRWLKALHLVGGLGLVLILSLVWLIPLSIATHSNFLWDMIHLDVMPKLSGGQQSHGLPPGFFLLSSLVTLWPASVLLVASLFYACKQRKDYSVRFLLAWIIPSYFLYELIPTKLPQYLLPIYPALALLMAISLVSGGYSKFPYPKVLRCFYSVWLLLSGTIAIGFVVLSYLLEAGIPLIIWLNALIVVCASIYLVSLLWQNRIKDVALAVVLISVCSYPLVFEKIIPSFNSLWITERIRTVILSEQPALDAQHPLIVLAYSEPSLVFRLGTHNVLFTTLNAVAEKLREGAAWVLIEQQQQTEFEHILAQHALSMQPLKTIHGWPLNSGHPKILILYRKG